MWPESSVRADTGLGARIATQRINVQFVSSKKSLDKGHSGIFEMKSSESSSQFALIRSSFEDVFFFGPKRNYRVVFSRHDINI